MTDKDALRDARLAHALRHMPDAHMQPSAEARLAVLKHAQQALSGGANTAPPAARRWWQSTPPSAWGGALASVLVASFITLMWYGQPVPDANPEGLPVAEQEIRATAPATPTADAAKAAPAPPIASPIAPPIAPTLAPPAAEKKRETAPRLLPPPPPVKEMAAPPVAVQVPQPAPIAPAAPAPMAAPAPAPPAPSTVAKSQAADSALALPPAETAAAPPVAAIAGRMQRNRADFLSAATVTVTQGSRSTRLGVGPAAALLAALRALPYEAPANNLQVAADSPVFTVQSAQGEVWAISPHRVVLRTAQFTAEAKQAPQASVSTITDAQWQELRGLAQAAP